MRLAAWGAGKKMMNTLGTPGCYFSKTCLSSWKATRRGGVGNERAGNPGQSEGPQGHAGKAAPRRPGSHFCLALGCAGDKPGTGTRQEGEQSRQAGVTECLQGVQKAGRPQQKGQAGKTGGRQAGLPKPPTGPPGDRELALQRHLATGEELRPEGDPGPRKKSRTRTSDPRWQVLYFQHIPDLGTFHSPAGERQEGGRSACTCLHP